MRTINDLLSDLNIIKGLLNKNNFVSLTDKDQILMKTEATRLLNKIETESENILIVGFMGGTGVGKSSIMNAIAGETISSSSHRRPHTKDIIIYRHTNTTNPLLATDSFNLKYKEIVHTAEPSRYILLCDLPDFDSINTENYEKVKYFSEYLDLLLWVTTPEKYADAKFYRFLKDTVKSPFNYYFILNKIDILFDAESNGEGFEKLSKIIENFTNYISKAGIAEPVIYALSAAEVIADEKPSAWNQFTSFKQQLLKKREKNIIKAIKTANINAEIATLISQFDKEISSVEDIIAVLDKCLLEIESFRKEWRTTGKILPNLSLKKEVKNLIIAKLSDTKNLLGPAGFIYSFLFYKKHAVIYNDFAENKFEIINNELKIQIKFLAERIKGIFFSHSFPEKFQISLLNTVSPDILVSKFSEKIHQAINQMLSNIIPLHFKTFRIIQYASYLFLIVALLFSFGDNNSWQIFIASPTPITALKVIISIISGIFSPHGLAALSSFTLLFMFLNGKFIKSYRQKLEKTSSSMFYSFSEMFISEWEKIFDSVPEKIISMKKDMEIHFKEINATKRHFIDD